MAWTTPATQDSGTIITSTIWNEQVADNLTHLFNRLEANNQYTANEVSNYTTTSTTFEDVDATNFALTITTNGGEVLVGLAASAEGSVQLHMNFEIDVDGSGHFGDDGLLSYEISTASRPKNVSFVVQITGLSAGSHTFKLQWKVSTGTGTMWAGAGTTDTDCHSQFWVQEI